MGFTDNKYRRIHLVGEVVAEWADLVCQLYRLGKRREGTLHSLDSVRIHRYRLVTRCRRRYS